MSDFIFSEHGEDVLIHRLLLWKEHGFYLDCGAYHSRNMSMTARLRLFGWNGVNIDVDPDVVAALQNDLLGTESFCAALGSEDGREVVFHKYADPVLNTILPAQHSHLQRIETTNQLFTSFTGSEKVKTTSLRTMIKKSAHLRKIDFVNIDVEGVELDVLQGFPWDEQQPSVFAVEIHGLNLCKTDENEVVNFMRTNGYKLQSYVFHTAIFCLQDFDTELCHRVPAKRL